MELSERKNLARRIRMDDLNAIKEFIVFLYKIVLDFPLEIYETKYSTAHESVRWNLEFEDTKYIYLYNLTLLLLNDNLFMRRFERITETPFIITEIKEQLNYCIKYLNYEVTKQNEENIFKEIRRIHFRIFNKDKNKLTFDDKNQNIFKKIKNKSNSLPEVQREIFHKFMFGTPPELIAKMNNISLKQFNYNIKNNLIYLENKFDFNGNKNV